MIRLAVCDDDKVIANNIEEILSDFFSSKYIENTIEVFYDGEVLQDFYKKGQRFDIIYLDIEMPIINGVDVAKIIRQFDHDVIIIYVSSHETYFIELFKVEAFRFIKKPININELYEFTQLAYNRIIEQNVYFEFKYNKMEEKVLLRNIEYFESKGRVIKIVTKQKSYKFYSKLDDVEVKLKYSNIPFLRIHKSFYVNFNFVEKIAFTKIVLINGKELQISKERRSIIRYEYMKILGGVI